MKLAGRSEELRRFRSFGEQALQQGTGGVVVIRGPEGIGKSAMVEHGLAGLNTPSAPDAAPAVGRGRCPPGASRTVDYEVFVGALAELDAANPTLAARGAKAGLLAELAPDWLAVVPVVGAVLSAGYATTTRLRERGGHAFAASRDSLFSQYIRVVETLAADRPLVLILEDFQHADAASAALLAHLARRVRDLPVLLVVMLRDSAAGTVGIVPGMLLELERENLARVISLGPLPAEAARQVLAAALGGPADPPLERWAMERSEGIPLRLLQLAERLAATGAVERRRGTWRFAPGQPADAGDDLPEELAARYRRVDTELLRTLQYASVLGTAFESTALARLLDDDELQVLEALARLEGEFGLLASVAGSHERPTDGAARYAFRSRRLREHVHGHVRGRRRLVLHERAAALTSEAETSAAPSAAAGTPAAVTSAADPAAAARPIIPSTRPPPLPDDAGARHPIDGAHFVGRRSELDRIVAAVDEMLADGKGRAVFVRGPAGTGKSTVVARAMEEILTAHRDVAVARGRCLQTFDSAEPYLPFVDALRDLTDRETEGWIERETLSAILTDLAPYWVAAVPLVGGLLSASLITAQRFLDERATAPSREVLLGEYAAVIRGLAARTPLVLYLDDLHWVDHASAMLLAHLLETIQDIPVVVVATLRPLTAEDAARPATAVLQGLEKLADTSWLELGELPDDVLLELLRAEFAGDVSVPLARWITETAGGNPLFASELCRLLKEAGAAAPVRGEWHLTERLDGLGVPRSAEAVIEHRVGRLDSAGARALQTASVEGNQFSSVLLAHLLGEEEPVVLERFRSLEREHQLVQIGSTVPLPDGRVSTTIQFHHALVQTVLYRSLNTRRRTLLHRRSGEVLEAIFGAEADRLAGKLARHFHAGTVAGKAAHYARLAAADALRSYAQWEAEEFLRIALEHSATPEARVAVAEQLGEVYDTVGYYDRGVAELEGALEGIAPGDDRAVRLRRKILFLQRKAGAVKPALLVRGIRALLLEAPAGSRDRCELLLELGRFRDQRDADGAVEEAVGIAATLGDPALLARALEQRAVVLIYASEPGASLPLLDRALTLVGEDPLRAAFNRNIAGVALAKLGRYPEALEAFSDQLGFVERVGHQNGMSAACINMGHMLLRLGRMEEAEAILQRARVMNERRDRSSLTQSLFNLAERARRAGEHTVAVERYASMLDVAEETGDARAAAVAEAGRGLCFLAQHDTPGAQAAAERAERHLPGDGAWFEDREFLHLLNARLAHMAGRHGVADAELRAATTALRERDVFAWGMVAAEWVRQTADRDPAAARARLDEVRAATAGVQSSLDKDVEALAARLAERSTPAASPAASP